MVLTIWLHQVLQYQAITKVWHDLDHKKVEINQKLSKSKIRHQEMVIQGSNHFQKSQNLHIACTWHVQPNDVIRIYHSSQDKKWRFLVILNSGGSWPHSWLATCLSKHLMKFGYIWTTNERSKHQIDDRTRRHRTKIYKQHGNDGGLLT